jgi:hypothetical protein
MADMGAFLEGEMFGICPYVRTFFVNRKANLLNRIDILWG